MNGSDSVTPLRRVGVVLVTAGAVTGFVAVLGLLSGDEQGRVNLLYLLMLFVFLPVLGLLLSLVFLLRSRALGLAGWLLELPVWPAALRQAVLALAPARRRKYWLFYQTQLLVVAFALGGMLAFFLLLLASDISFVWRSTLLDAGNLMPVLDLLAWPWRFWEAAQPREDLLLESQDFRLAAPEHTAALLGQWWRYALAAQCAYNLLPRALMLVLARQLSRRAGAERPAGAEPGQRLQNPLNVVPMRGRLAPVVDSVRPGYSLLDWAQLSPVVLAAIEKNVGEYGQHVVIQPLFELGEHQLLGMAGRDLVVGVKAWEPPMGELHDYLLGLPPRLRQSGLLLPLDWDDGGLRRPSAASLEEWRRFCGTLPGWAVLSLDGDRAS